MVDIKSLNQFFVLLLTLRQVLALAEENKLQDRNTIRPLVEAQAAWNESGKPQSYPGQKLTLIIST